MIAHTTRRQNHSLPLQWRHNWRDGVSNHQPHDCLLNHLFMRRSKKTSKLRVTGLCAGNSPVTDEFPHKWPITRKMFALDDVIIMCPYLPYKCHLHVHEMDECNICLKKSHSPTENHLLHMVKCLSHEIYHFMSWLHTEIDSGNE